MKRQSTETSRDPKPHIVLFFLFLGIAFASLITASDLVRPTDFAQDYSAAWSLMQGTSIYGAEQDAMVRAVTPLNSALSFHPPTNALVHSPLTALSYSHALLIYRVLSVTFYLLALVMYFRGRNINLSESVVLASATLFWYPVLEGLGCANVSLWVGGTLLMGLAATQQQRPLLGGIFLGVASSLKLYPLLLVPVLWSVGFRRAAVAAASSFVVIMILTLKAVGAEDFILYFTSISPQNIELFLGYPLTVSFGSIVASAFRPTTLSEPLLHWPRGAFLLGGATTVVISAITVALGWRYRAQTNFAIALGLVGMCIATPIGWSHSLIVLPPVLAVLMGKTNDSGVLSGVRLTPLTVAIFILLSWPVIPIYRYC